jgi:hypothetical protein
MLSDADRDVLIATVLEHVEAVMESPGHGEIIIEISHHDVRRIRPSLSFDFRRDLCKPAEVKSPPG